MQYLAGSAVEGRITVLRPGNEGMTEGGSRKDYNACRGELNQRQT